MCAQAHSELSLQIWYVAQTYEAKTEGVLSPLLQCSPRMALSFFLKKTLLPIVLEGSQGARRAWEWRQQKQAGIANGDSNYNAGREFCQLKKGG